MKRLLVRIFEAVSKYSYEAYKKRNKKKLKNKVPTIISNNCVGGVIYHVLGLQFTSPTINLWFTSDDYFEFLEHLEDYLSVDPKEIKVEGIDYPVGKLERGERSIIVYFMHYKSFDEACAKWNSRKSRIDLDNLYIIFDYGKNTSADDPFVEKFKNLKYENKVMLTDTRNLESDADIVHIPAYEKDIYSGKILDRASKYTFKKHYDVFDYVSFLNK